MIGNRIGLDAGGTPTLGNTFSGINIQFGRHVFIGGLGPGEGNQVAGDGLGNGVGVSVGKSGSINNWVAGNLISNNAYMGVSIMDYASRTVVVRNTITSSSSGVWIRQGTMNTLRANSIFDNASSGIQLLDGGNQALAAPVITGLTPAGVTGTACANCLVEVFMDLGRSQGPRYRRGGLGGWRRELQSHCGTCSARSHRHRHRRLGQHLVIFCPGLHQLELVRDGLPLIRR